MPSPSERWPTQGNIKAVFGEPGNAKCTAGICELAYPMRIAWDLDHTIKRFRCHTLVAEPLERIFAATLKEYGLPQVQKLGLDIFGGCYNFRQMRGGKAWSMHAWGIAVDLDPEHNQLKWNHTKARFAKPEYEAFWKIVESEGFCSLGRRYDYDWMHMEATGGR